MNRKLIFNFIFNILSTVLPLVFLQLLILPLIGKEYGQDKYGLVIALTGISTLFSSSFGSVLNNVKLISKSEYDVSEKGDFNIILIIFIAINIIFVITSTFVTIRSFDLFLILIIAIFSTLNLVKEYATVEFRINLNYRKILYTNIALSIGYLIGYGLFILTSEWTLIYLTGLLVCLLYIYFNSNILKENYKVTKKFAATLKKNIILFISTFLSEGVAHIDKIMLIFLLSASSVSVYYTATFSGKFLGLAITPISAVLLSVFANMDHFEVKNFYKILFASLAIGFFAYFLILWISPYLIRILYPEWADDSIQLIQVTTGVTIIGIMKNIINPIILKFRSINWQLILKGSNFIVTIIISFIFLYHYGLLGFAFGILIASFISWVLHILVFIYAPSTKLVEFNQISSKENLV